MSELFTRVTDPTQARLCDFLVLPPTKRLKLSPKTLSSLGLPSGFTCRSSNQQTIVNELFCKGATRVFFLSSVRYTVISETERLLNPFATELTPEVWTGMLFPFGEVSEGLEFSAWMDAYVELNETYPTRYPAAIEHAFLRAGYDHSMALTDSTPRIMTVDSMASEVCEMLRSCGAPGADATRCIPYSDGGAHPVQMCLGSLGLRSQGDESVYCMGFIRGSFLTELVKRGALLIRPSDAMLEAITNNHLRWYAGCVHKAFGDRIKTVDLTMDQLRLARKADKAREAKWARVERLTAKLSSKCMEAFTQALEGMASDAQKGKKG